MDNAAVKQRSCEPRSGMAQGWQQHSNPQTQIQGNLPAGNHHFPKSTLTVGNHAEAFDPANSFQKIPLVGGSPSPSPQ